MQRNLDVVLPASARVQDRLQLPAKISFDLKDDARKLTFWIVGTVGEQLPHGGQNQGLRFAGADCADYGDTRVQATFWNRQPLRQGRRFGLQLMMHFTDNQV